MNEISVRIPTSLFDDMGAEWIENDFEIEIDIEESIKKCVRVLRERLFYWWPETKFDIDVDDYYIDIKTNAEEEERISEIINTTIDNWTEIVVLKDESLGYTASNPFEIEDIKRPEFSL